MSILVRDDNGMPTGYLRPGRTQRLSVTTTPTLSEAFGEKTNVLRLAVYGEHCYYKIGANPVADEDDSILLPVNAVEYIACRPGDKISVVGDQGHNPKLHVTEMF